MSPTSANFTEKVLSKLGKIDRPRVERFVRGVVRERDFQEAIFEALAEGVIVTEPDGRVVMINRLAREMIGATRRVKVIGRPLDGLIRDGALRDLLSAWDGERVSPQEISIETPDPRDLIVTLRSVRDRDTGEVTARVMILADVTELRRRQREDARTERLSSLALLTAGVAHEIKNPLNALRIHGQLLQQAIDEAQWPSEVQGERSRRSAEIILEETQRLARTVEQFMQAVRPVEINRTRHSANVILRRVLEAVAPHECDPPVEVDLHLAPDLPDVWVDDQQMAQVFLNLIRNAIDSLDKPTRRLTLTTRAVDKTLEVTIADNGCGIAREDLDRIYQPYFTTKFNGTGLGLMVVHRIIGDHGGRLVIKSREGEGTEVTILLPLAKRAPRLLTQSENEEAAP